MSRPVSQSQIAIESYLFFGDFKNTNNRMEIHHDDCFNVFPKIKEPVHLVLVDLPYAQTACKWDTCIDLKKMWIELKKMSKECIYIFFCTTKFGYKLIQSNEKWFRYDLVWEKSRKVGFLNANKQPLRKHEMVYVFKDRGSITVPGTYNPQKTEGKRYVDKRDYVDKAGYYRRDGKLYPHKPQDNHGMCHPTSIVKFDNPKKSVHKTQKPTALLSWLIKSYSNEGDTVLDFTMGSGSTGVACIETNRKFIGVEKDKDIFEIAKARLNFGAI